MNAKLRALLDTRTILSLSQFDFRAVFSTGNAVPSGEFKNIDKGKKYLAVFLDLAKDFDTVSISLSIRKLERVVIRDMQLKSETLSVTIYLCHTVSRRVVF